MKTEARQALKTVLVTTLIVAALVALAWWSMAGLVLVTLAALLGLAVGWRLGYRHGVTQAEPVRRARRRGGRPQQQSAQPSNTMMPGERVMRRPARPKR